MRKTEVVIEFYSETLENDVALSLRVNYEAVEGSIITGFDTFGETPTEEDTLDPQFLDSDITVLTELPDHVLIEFFNNFSDYRDEIYELIFDEINK